jgi:hypothetical protein
MNKFILVVELVWKQPLWVLDKYKYGLIIKVLGKEFKLLVSRKISKKELDKKKYNEQYLSDLQQESKQWFEIAYKTNQTASENIY